MTTAPYPQVTNELLSAYIDEAVSEEERRLIESAVAQDPDIAWRLESLRATVRLLHELPALSLPRSFLLTPEQVSQGVDIPAEIALSPQLKQPQTVLAPAKTSPAGEGGFWLGLWRGWMHLWQGGNPALRNAMAASFAVLLVLLLAPRFFVAPRLPAAGELATFTSQAPAAPREASGEGAGEVMSAGAAAKTAEGEATVAEMEVGDDTANLTAPAAAVEAAEIGTTEVEASDALFTTVPVAPASQAEGVTLAQSASGASVLDEMQRQAGGGAPAAAAASVAEGAVEGAPPIRVAPEPGPAAAASAQEPDGMAVEASSAASDFDVAQAAAGTQTAASSVESPAEDAVAEAGAPLPSLVPLATENAPAIALEPAAGDQVEAGDLLATSAAPMAESPAWVALVLLAGAWLAALATTLFGLLWWRSRPS